MNVLRTRISLWIRTISSERYRQRQKAAQLYNFEGEKFRVLTTVETRDHRSLLMLFQVFSS